MITAIIFIIVLAILILVHEFGHFIVAKKSGIRVDEFGLGFPPRMIGKKFGGTIYSLNWIPFGGFVKIFGENPDAESESGPDSARSFINKNRWIQAAVLVAGVAFNFIFAWILISVAFFSGVPASTEDYSQYADRMHDQGVVLTMVVSDSPASKAGLKMGDMIANFESSEKLKKGIEAGEPININFTRAGVASSTTVTPVQGVISSAPEKFAIGISMGDVGTLSLPVHLAIYEGAKYTVYGIKEVAVGLGTFVWQIVAGKPDYSAVTGPVGIAGFVGDAARAGFSNLLMFIAIISINLGVINLVPFPALDGGRLLFVLIEGVTRRKIPAKVANMVNTVGFALLLLLMVFVTYKDIIKLF